MDDLSKLLAEFDEGLAMIAHAQEHANSGAVKLLAAIMRRLFESMNLRIEKQRLEIAYLKSRINNAQRYMASEPWRHSNTKPIGDEKPAQNGHK